MAIWDNWFGNVYGEYKQLMKDREKELDRRMAPKKDKIDIRKVTSLGDAYSPAAYDMAHKIFPHKLDTGAESMEKMARIALEWKPRSDLTYHVYGPYVLCALTCVTSVYITGHFRHFLRLGSYARKVMYSTSAFFPICAVGLYNQFRSNLQIALRGEKCTSCIAVKSAMFQSFCSVLYPSIFTIVLGFYYANAYHTVPSVPPKFLHDREQAKHVGKLIAAIVERSHFTRIMMALFLVNMFAGYHISQRQQEECIWVFKKILDKQEMIVQANRGVAIVDSDVGRGSL